MSLESLHGEDPPGEQHADGEPARTAPKRDERGPAALPTHRQGGSCLAVLGLWAILAGVVIAAIGGVLVLMAVRGKKDSRIESPPGDVQTFECTKGGCAARMGGPSRWTRVRSSDVPDPGIVLLIQSSDRESVFLVRCDPLEGDLTSEEAIDAFLRIEETGRETWRGDLQIDGEKIRAVRVQLTKDGVDTEGYVTFAIRNDQLFQVMSMTSRKNMGAMDSELRRAVEAFRLPAVETVDRKPDPPLALSKPEALPPSGMSDAPPGVLAAAAHAVVERDPARAAALQRLAVDKGYDQGKYNLACYESRAGHVDAAFYWLQRAAVDNGVNPGWAEEDRDLEALRADPRWAQIRVFLRRTARWWIAHTPEREAVTSPKSPSPPGGRPVVIGMHGLGSVPEDFSGPSIESAANRAGVAFVSLSGTNAFGPRSFSWAEDPALDRARIDRGLAAIAGQVVPAKGKLITIGFSQGAQMAAEIAARDPEHFAGAIVMSPGTRKNLNLEGLPASISLAGRRFLILVGAGEHPATVARAKADAERLRALGAEVHHHPYPDQDAHTFPPDFDSALPRWISFILDGKPL